MRLSTNVRLFLHIPVGLLNVFFALICPPLSILFFIGFMIYELSEDWRIKDQAYKDIAGYLWGLAIGGIGLFLWGFLK